MHSAHGFRSLSFLLDFALLLAAPWPVAARPSETPRSEAAAGPIHLLLDWLAGLWGDAGCTFDPSGLCRDAAAAESEAIVPDAGCTFDPDGMPCRGDR